MAHRTAAGLDSGIYSKWKEQAARRTGIMRPLSGQPPDRAGCTWQSWEESQEIRRIKGSGSYITGLSDQESRNVIGVLIPDEQQYQYPAFVNNLRTALAAYGYTCKVFPTYGHQDEERQILQFLLKNPLRAILAEPVKSALPTLNTELYQMLLQKGTAVFFLGCAYPGLSQVPVLSGNPDYGASLLVQDLAAKGHTCIAGIFQMVTCGDISTARAF